MKFTQKASSKDHYPDSCDPFSSNDLESFAPVHPLGPLTCYQNEATFCWRRFRILFHTLDELKMKHKLTFKRVKRILELHLADHQEFLANPNLYFAWVGAVGMINDFF